MELVDTAAHTGFFEVVADTAESQAATMTLAPGRATGGPENRHPESDQWCYVASGAGEAVVDGSTATIAAGDLVLIEAGEPHEIRNTGDENLVTVNVYAPPVY